MTQAQKNKISGSLKERWKNIKLNTIYKCEKCGKSFTTERKIRKDRKVRCDNCKRTVPYVKIHPSDILQISSRTASKILKRAKVRCSICEWNKASLDLHHIKNKKAGGLDNHSNLIPLCPNCHRLVHEKLIDLTKYKNKTLNKVLLNWSQYYNKRV